MPGTPMSGVSAGATTSDSANVAPIVMPIAAIARVRTASRVRSAVSAITAAEIAPAPCTVRPTMVHRIVGAHAAMKLPEREDHEPGDDDGFPAPAIGGPAERNLQHRLREPVGAEREADQRVVAAAGERLRVQREHRQHDEHAEHPQAEDAGEAGRRATLGGRHAHRRGSRDGRGRAVVRHGANERGDGGGDAERGNAA